VYHHPTWINGGRVARALETIVNPGEFGTFEWEIQRNEPAEPEWFQLLVEYHVWLPDTFFRLPDPVAVSTPRHCRSSEPALI
jgi:hypothetical protein